MARALGVLAALALLAMICPSQAEVGPSPGWKPPAFCRDKQCPEFTVVQTAGDTELRRYKPAHWVMVNMTDTKWDDAYKKGYKMLADYINGHNEGGVKLDNTNPSLTIFYPAKTGKSFQSLFTIEYFVPYELQEAPPQPKAQELGVLHVPEQEVWVLSFGGFATEQDITTRSFDFIERLEQQKVELDKTWIGYAQYDLPARLLDRHNEIWAFVKGKAPSAAEAAGTAATEVQEQACSFACRVVRTLRRLVPGMRSATTSTATADEPIEVQQLREEEEPFAAT